MATQTEKHNIVLESTEQWLCKELKEFVTTISMAYHPETDTWDVNSWKEYPNNGKARTETEETM